MLNFRPSADFAEVGRNTHFFILTMQRSERIRNIEGLLRPVVEGLGYELVDLQLRSESGRMILRLLADRPGGITLDECARLSREVSPHLEVADPIRGRYVLEVSSPGIQRPLRRREDFERFRGEKVVVRTSEPLEGRKTFRGKNRGVDEGGNLVVEENPERCRAIPLSLIRAAHLDPDIRF
jgi:ribosome maturation factor RimP